MLVGVSYDKEFDTLYIYREGEASRQSVEMFDNFVVDMDSYGKAVDLEIMGASEVLNVPRKALDEVKEANLSTVAIGYYFGVNYVIILPNKNRIEGRLMVPLPSL